MCPEPDPVVGRLQAAVAAELRGVRVVADVTRLDDDQVTAVVRLGPCRLVATLPPARPWSNGKAPKCLGIRMIGKPWLSSAQKAREGMIVPGSNPNERQRL